MPVPLPVGLERQVAHRARASTVDRVSAADADSTTVVATAELERLQAAEDACWSMMLAIDFGGMNRVPMGWRQVVVGGGLQRWTDLAAEQGLFPYSSSDQEDSGSS